MNIEHCSQISQIDQNLIARGYGEECLCNMIFRYQNTKKQIQANHALAETIGMNSQEWRDNSDKAAQMRSEHMACIMKALAAKLCCHQYDPSEDIPFCSPDWDLFFWCNTFGNTTNGRMSGRDYGYFTLSFNEAHSKEKREQIFQKVLEVLKDFETDEHLSVTVLRSSALNEKKIAKDAKEIAKQLTGKPIRHRFVNELFNLASGPVDGHVVEVNGQFYFMKKRARSRGCLLSNQDILQIYWDNVAGGTKNGQ